MTREEAIKELKELEYYGRFFDNSETEDKKNKALFMAIEAIEQEPCEDAISRQAVLDGLASIAKAKAKSDAQKSMMGRTMFFVEQLPSVSTEKTGRWKWVQYDFDPIIGNWHCSECRNILVYAVTKDDEDGIPLAKYCPNCGCRMMGVEE